MLLALGFILLTIVRVGVTTLRKTGVPPRQLTGLLAQADHLIPIPSQPRRKHP